MEGILGWTEKAKGRGRRKKNGKRSTKERKWGRKGKEEVKWGTGWRQKGN